MEFIRNELFDFSIVYSSNDSERLSRLWNTNNQITALSRYSVLVNIIFQ